MNKQELIKLVSQDTGLTQKEATAALQAFEFRIQEAVVNGEQVSLKGFGTFGSKVRSERQGRNPKTGENILIPAKKVPTFKFGGAFKEAVA